MARPPTIVGAQVSRCRMSDTGSNTMTKEGEWNGQQGLKRLAQILHKRAHVMGRLLAHSRAVARQLQGAEIQPIRREELPRPEKHGVAGSMGKAKETAANPRVLASIGNPAVKRHPF